MPRLTFHLSPEKCREVLHSARARLCITGSAMADLVGISDARWYRIESGKDCNVSPRTFAKIAAALNLTIQALEDQLR